MSDGSPDNVNQDNTPVFQPVDLVGWTFLMQPDEDGNKYRARIAQLVEDFQDKNSRDPQLLKFKVSINNDEFEELMTYQQVLDHILADEQTKIMWKYKRIIGHQEGLKPGDKDYKGSLVNVTLWNGRMGRSHQNPLES